MGLVEKAVAVATNQTEYEVLTRKIENLKAEKARLEAKAQKAIDEAATALVEGKPEPVFDATISQKLAALDEAIRRLEAQRRAAEPAYLRAKLAEIEREFEAASARYEQERQQYEAAKQAFEEAEKRWNHFMAVEHEPKVRQLWARRDEIEARLRELEQAA